MGLLLALCLALAVCGGPEGINAHGYSSTVAKVLTKRDGNSNAYNVSEGTAQNSSSDFQKPVQGDQEVTQTSNYEDLTTTTAAVEIDLSISAIATAYDTGITQIASTTENLSIDDDVNLGDRNNILSHPQSEESTGEVVDGDKHGTETTQLFTTSSTVYSTQDDSNSTTTDSSEIIQADEGRAENFDSEMVNNLEMHRILENSISSDQNHSEVNSTETEMVAPPNDRTEYQLYQNDSPTVYNNSFLKTNDIELEANGPDTTDILDDLRKHPSTQDPDALIFFDEDTAIVTNTLSQEELVGATEDDIVTVPVFDESVTIEPLFNGSSQVADNDKFNDTDFMSNDAAVFDPNFGKEGILLPDFFTLAGHGTGEEVSSKVVGNEEKEIAPAALFASPFEDSSRFDVFDQSEDGKELTSKPTSLAFVFDTTGSMHDDLKQVRRGTDGILEILERPQTIVENYVLVPFNDPGVEEPIVTSDPEVFKESLRRLRITSGGDCPEMSLTGIKKAIIAAKPGASVYVFTDASSKDYYLLPQVLAMIQRKHSKIVFVLTGDCGDTDEMSYQAYEKIAATSLGQVFHLNKTDVEEVLAYVRKSLGTERINKGTQNVDLLSVNKPNASKDEQHNLYIDESVKEFTVSVSGKNPKIELVNPDGEDIKGPPKAKPLLNLENVKVVNVDQPEPGEWKVKVSSDSGHTVRSKGLSEINFSYGFSRLPTEKLKETSHIPLTGTQNSVLIRPTKHRKVSNLSKLKLIDMKGNVIQEIPLEPVPNKKYLYHGIEPFIPPEDYFYLEINGIDKDGFPIKRITPTAIAGQKPDNPVVTVETEVFAVINKPFALYCQVESLVPFSLIWFKDGHPVRQKEKFEQTAESVLEIKNVTKNSQGEYKCWAMNNAGSASATTKLSVTGPPPIVKTTETVFTSTGKIVEIHCTVDSEFPYNQTWVQITDDSGTLSEGNIRHIGDQRGVILANGNLLIHETKQEDKGFYFCVAENKGGKSYGKTFLQVQDPVKVSVNPKLFEFSQSTTIILECKIDKNVEAVLTWRKNGKVINETSRKVKLFNLPDFSRIVIENATQFDEGTYECEGLKNDHKDTDNSVGRYVEIPDVTAVDHLLSAIVGSSVTLECLVTGIPYPAVTWLHNGTALSESRLKIISDGILKFPNVELHDAGNYTCIAENHLGTAEENIVMDVGVPPYLLQPPSDTDVDIGKNVTVPCVTTGVPNPTVSWKRKDGNTLDESRTSVMDTGHLKINGVTLMDEATYVCTSQNKYGSVESEFILKITGLIKPVVEESGDHDVVVPLGQTTELTCQIVVGVPSPTVLWYKDGEVLDEDQMIWEGISLQANNSLIIPYVSHKHEGAYECEAKNPAGVSLKNIHIAVIEPPTFKHSGPVEQHVNIGGDVLLPCDAEGDPKPLIYWMKDGMPLQQSDQVYMKSGDGSLYIRNVELDNSGTYSCKAVNSAGSAEKKIVVTVKAAPKITSGPASINAVDGQIVTLNCKATGIPTPVITWYKNDEPITLYKKDIIFVENNSTIRFLVRSSDTGTYKCVAKNEAGSNDRKFRLSVFVPPSIHPPSEELVQSSIGHEIVLNCHVSGSPQPSIIWWRDEEIINSSLAMSILDNGNLYIRKADLGSAGVYACEAENHAGVTQKLFYVIVHAPPQIVDVTPSKIELMAGESYSVPCNAYGSPMPHVSWRKNGQTIFKNQGDVTVSDDNSLSVISASHQTSGLYTCVAENSEGSYQKNVFLDVLVPPSMIEPEDSVLEVKEGDSIVITCPAIDASPPPKIQWLKDGRRLGEPPEEDHYDLNDFGRSLKLFNVSPSDKGTYSCLAVNIIGHTTAAFTVDVLQMPHFHGINDKVKVNAITNSEVKLECPVSGHPKPQIHWQKNGHPVSPKITPSVVLSKSKQYLLINSIRSHDAGTYTCVATNKIGQAERNFDVSVIDPPKIAGPVEENQEVVKGDLLMLECPATGNPEPDIHWSKDEDRTLFIQKSNVALSHDFKILEISNIQSEDAGYYVCTAVNNAGSKEKKFFVTVLDPPIIEENFIEDMAIKLGDTVTLMCKAYGYPEPEITWLHNGHIISQENSVHNDRVTIGNMYDLHTLEIRSAQILDSGKYSCLASNIAGVSEKNYHLTVQIPPRLTEEPDQINILESIAGSPVTIKCPARGDPKPDFYWYKDGVQINTFNLRSPEILFISKTSVNDSGNYTCVAMNSVGNTSKSFQLDVYVPPLLAAGDEQVNLNIKRNSDLNLNCNVSGHPQPDILWFKGSTPIETFDWPYIEFEDNNSILIVPNVTSVHSGKYSCLAINMAGTVEKKFDVEVQEPPTLETGVLPVQNNRVKIHQRTVLKCELKGSPPPVYAWYKNGIQLKNYDSENIYISSNGKQLHLMYALEEDSGLYACIAKNPAGSEQLAFQLKVEAPAEWREWSDWSECSTTCGPGQQVRKRECSSQYADCHGSSEEWQNCYMVECQVHGGWSGWSEWTPCSSSCGLSVRQRFRKCDNPTPAYGGEPCHGDLMQQEYCHQSPCPIHGNWSEWSEWGPCSSSCGYGIKYRSRHCTNPPPDFGGNDCFGPASESTSCNMHKCPVHGGWSEWGSWSPCSVPCGLGTKQRFRTCSNPFPLYGGASCSGENLQVAKCMIKRCNNLPLQAALLVRGNLNGENLTDQIIAANISDFGSKRTIEAAISDVLKRQAGWFPYLTFMLSPVSWNTAFEEDQANNGYSLTHGNFRQQSQVEFSSGEELKLRHIGHGINDNGALQVEIEISGEVPVVQPEASIQIQPYEEDYVQTGPGTLFATASSVLDINGLKLPYTWNNTVQYDRYKGTMPFLVEKLSAEDIGIEYDPDSHEMRYKMSTTIQKKYRDNLCPEGFVHDEKRMHCRDIDECSKRHLNRCHVTQICENLLGTYRCSCRKGYKSLGIGKRCTDINECQADPTVCSHHCHNVKGSFKCLCPPGYTLLEDKRTCADNLNLEPDSLMDWQDAFEERNKYVPLEIPYSRPPKRSKHLRNRQLKLHNEKPSTNKSICQQGFTIKNGICEDINECNITPNVCSTEQTCLNKKGSYLCLNTPCPDGYERDPHTKYCLIYCDERHICDEGAKVTQTVSFMVLSPEVSSIHPYQDLMQFSVRGDNGQQLPHTRYRIVENENGKPFRVRFENGQGILYSLKNLESGKLYRTAVLAVSYDTDERTILHTTKFILFIDLSDE